MDSRQVTPPPGFVLIGGDTPPPPPPGFVSMDSAIEAANSKYTVHPPSIEAFQRFGSRLKDRTAETLSGLGSLAGDALKSSLTMEGQAKFLPRLAGNLYEGLISSGADAIARQLPNGAEAPSSDQMLRAGVASIPVVGSYPMSRISDIEEGKAPEALADVAFDAASMMVPGTRAGRAGSEAALSGAVKGAEMTGRAAKAAAVKVGPEVAGMAAGAAISGGTGGIVGGFLAHQAKAAVSKWFAERFKVSPAKAEVIVGKMKPEQVAAIAEREALLEAKQISAVEDKVFRREVSDAKKQASFDAKAEKIRPIPPSKLPPVLPDPVVHEISAAKAANGDLWDVKTGKRLQLTPEQAREAVAGQPWNQGKKAAPKVEKAAEVAPVTPKASPMALHQGTRVGEEALDASIVAGIDGNAQQLVRDIDQALTIRKQRLTGKAGLRESDEIDLLKRLEKTPIKTDDLRRAFGFGRKDLEGAKGIVRESGKALDLWVQEHGIPEGWVTSMQDFEHKLGKAMAGEKVYPLGANAGMGAARETVEAIAGEVGATPKQIRDALLRDKSNPLEMQTRKVLAARDPYDAIAQADEFFGRNPDAEMAAPARVTIQPDLIDRIGKAISPDAAWKDLRKHGAGDGKRIPAKEAREMVDAVWSQKEPGYTSIEQWMADRAERWERSKRER